jgi:hypothetical protein
MTREAFVRLRKVWQSTLTNRGTKIKVFNACGKSVLSMAVRPVWLQTN